MDDNNFSISLDCDDVVSFEKDTFKVSRLKELMTREVKEKTHNRDKWGTYYPNFSRAINIGEEKIYFDYIKFELIENCQILQVNNKGWKKGELKIEICISPEDNNLDKVNLKFFPEQPNEPESPLDDIREMIQTN